jgi:hypothetical protein
MSNFQVVQPYMHNTSEKRREEVELTSKFIIPTPLLAILNNSLHSHACKFEDAGCFGAVIVEIGACKAILGRKVWLKGRVKPKNLRPKSVCCSTISLRVSSGLQV